MCSLPRLSTSGTLPGRCDDDCSLPHGVVADQEQNGISWIVGGARGTHTFGAAKRGPRRDCRQMICLCGTPYHGRPHLSELGLGSQARDQGCTTEYGVRTTHTEYEVRITLYIRILRTPQHETPSRTPYQEVYYGSLAYRKVVFQTWCASCIRHGCPAAEIATVIDIFHRLVVRPVAHAG